MKQEIKVTYCTVLSAFSWMSLLSYFPLRTRLLLSLCRLTQKKTRFFQEGGESVSFNYPWLLSVSAMRYHLENFILLSFNLFLILLVSVLCLHIAAQCMLKLTRKMFVNRSPCSQFSKQINLTAQSYSEFCP